MASPSAPPGAQTAGRRSRDRYDKPLVFTMTELNQNTAKVLDEINESGRPAAITKHGKFVVMIQPMAHSSVETLVFSHQSPLADTLLGEVGEAAMADDEDLLTDEDLDNDHAH